MKQLLLAFLLSFSLIGYAQPGAIDANFNPGGMAVNPEWGSIIKISTVTVQPNDDKILIGGYFFSYNGNEAIRFFTRLNADGTIDTTFNKGGTGANGEVSAIVIQPDGKILIGGRFSVYNGVLVSGIVRLNTDGTLDKDFIIGKGTDDEVETIALQPDGKILIGGWFSTYNEVACQSLARLNADGTLDASFNMGSGVSGFQTTPIVFSIALQSTGKILIGGQFTHYNGVVRNHIARLNTDGTLDNTFTMGTGMFGTLQDIVVKSNDQILLGGYFWSYNNVDRDRVALLGADGLLDPSFGAGWDAGADHEVKDIVLQPDGKILIGGQFTSYGGVGSKSIARLNANGTIDNTFKVGSGANHTVEAVAIQSNGNIVIGGVFSSYNDVTANRIARLHAKDLSITTSGMALSTYCAGTKIDVSFTATGGFTAGNIFTAQLSDATGSFATPLNIGTVSSTGSGKISVTLPFSAPTGSGYRIRVISSTPALAGTDNGQNLTITAAPTSPVINVQGSTTFCQGGSVLLTSSAGIDNQWYKDGVALNDATAQSYTVLSSGTYTVISTANGCASAPTPETVITVKAVPAAVITTSGNTTFCEGGSLALNSGATTGNQWYHNGVAITGATQQSLSVTQSGSYTLKVSQNECVSAESAAMVVTVKTTPATPVVTAATSTTICEGSSVELRSSATTGNQWLKDGVVITGETSQTYTATQAGSYTVKATNNGCSSSVSTSQTVVVIAMPFPTVVTPSGNTTFCEGSSVVLTSSKTSGNQWYKNGEAISNATASSYTATQSGNYTARIIENGCASVASDVIPIIIKPTPSKPTITQVGNTLTSSAAIGNQWFLNGEALTGATEQQYQVQASGVYTVRVTQNGCHTLSNQHNFTATAIVSPTLWNNEVMTYPNPLVKTLYIKNTAARKLDLQLVDALGKVVLRSQVTTTNASIDLGAFTSGVYRLLITDIVKQQTISISLVKQ